MIFLLVALQVQQHDVLFGRVAALQCAFLFASLKKDEGLKRIYYNLCLFLELPMRVSFSAF